MSANESAMGALFIPPKEDVVICLRPPCSTLQGKITLSGIILAFFFAYNFLAPPFFLEKPSIFYNSVELLCLLDGTFPDSQSV